MSAASPITDSASDQDEDEHDDENDPQDVHGPVVPIPWRAKQRISQRGPSTLVVEKPYATSGVSTANDLIEPRTSVTR
jgi:hypothetical protein